MPPKLTLRLQELDQLLAAHTISATEHADLRRLALGFASTPAPVSAVLEDSASKADRDLRALLTNLVGTFSAPTIAGQAWEYFQGTSGSQSAVEEIRTACSSSPARRAFAAAFRLAGNGVPPKDLLGDGPTFVFARHGAWDLLREIAAIVAVDVTSSRAADIDKGIFRRNVLRALDPDESTALSTALLTSIAKVESSTKSVLKVAETAPQSTNNELNNRVNNNAPSFNNNNHNLHNRNRRIKCSKCSNWHFANASCPRPDNRRGDSAKGPRVEGN